MNIKALVLRNTTNNEVIGAVGIGDSSTVTYFSFSENESMPISAEARVDFDTVFDKSSVNGWYIETEPYHITGTYGEYKLSIEDVEVK